MKKSIIIIILIAIAAIGSTQLWAQKEFAHEFSAYASGGLSTFTYNLSLGDKSGGVGCDFGFGYSCTLPFRGENDAIGIYTGFGLGFYNAKAKIDNQSYTSPNEYIDGDGDKFELTSSLHGYKERQRGVYLNIPVMGEYQFEQYYVRTGFKFGLPINKKYITSDAKLVNKAYYPELDSWVTDKEYAGCGAFTKSVDSRLDLGVAVLWALEAGYKLSLKSSLALYLGVYFDYSLNNVAKAGNKSLVDIKVADPAAFTLNSAMTTFTDKAHIMALGVKASITWKK